MLILHLHSNMELLLPAVCPQPIVHAPAFTFQYGATITKIVDMYVAMIKRFTFQYGATITTYIFNESTIWEKFTFQYGATITVQL